MTANARPTVTLCREAAAAAADDDDDDDDASSDVRHWPTVNSACKTLQYASDGFYIPE